MPLWGRFIFCILGVIAIGVGIRLFQQNLRTRQWNTTKGRILESAVTGVDKDFITVKYEYTVMGIKYIGDRFNVSRGSVGNAPQTVKHYRPGALVDVIYNPGNPCESALVRDPLGVPIFVISVGTVFLLVGLLVSF